jgi:hypothetical protein
MAVRRPRLSVEQIQLGPAARPALAEVEALRKDEVERVRKAAADSLKRIDPKGEGAKAP